MTEIVSESHSIHDVTAESRDNIVGPIEMLFARQTANKAAVRAGTARERIAKLKTLRKTLLERREALYAALEADMGKPPAEVDVAEIMPLLIELQHTIRHLRRWMKPKRIRTPLSFLGTTARVYHEPKGVALIIAPWNYPVQLALGPLISAVAAGNCVIIKPSEITPAASRFIKEIVSAVFDEAEVAVVEGDHRAAQALLSQPFDHIFFTGSSTVGRIVMKAAANHMSSVTLELGGKSPAIVDETADIEAAARKLVWGKFTNAGQTCIAPDYLYVHEKQRKALLKAMAAEVGRLYGSTTGDPNLTCDMTCIVDDRHVNRLRELLEDAVDKGAEIVTGGRVDELDRFIAPTILEQVSENALLMQEEIFGPILPVLGYTNIDEVLARISAGEKPLSFYLFTGDKKRVRHVMSHTTAGTTLINDTLVHFVHPSLPFGGVNNSGIGKAHGLAGFMAFTNERPTLRQHMKKPLLQQLYPPYTARTRKLTDLFFRYFRL